MLPLVGNMGNKMATKWVSKTPADGL
jgi:hypothetical protein